MSNNSSASKQKQPASPSARTPAKTSGQAKAPARRAPAKPSTRAGAAAKPAATRKAAPQKAASKPAAPAAKAGAKVVAKPVAKARTKPVVMPKASAPKTKPAKESKAGKSAPKKPKLVRDSFTFPQSDYELIAVLKQRALSAGREIKKSELLRAGLASLDAMSTASLVKALDAVERIKTGRPLK